MNLPKDQPALRELARPGEGLPATPGQVLEQLARRIDTFRPQPAPGPEGPDDRATRLNGLSNLFLALGLKGLNDEGPSAVQESVPPPLVEQGAEPQIEARPYTYTPFPKAPAKKPSGEGDERKAGWAHAVNTRRDRRDAYDGVQILPSWRGQYKKK